MIETISSITTIDSNCAGFIIECQCDSKRLSGIEIILFDRNSCTQVEESVLLFNI